MKPHFSPWTCAIVVALSWALGANVASADITITGVTAGSTIPGIDTEEAISDSTVTTSTIAYVAGADQAMKNALGAYFPTWTFTYAAGLNGTLNIASYMPTSTADDNGGGLIDATYTRAAGDPTIPNLHWIQMVTTNDPLGGGPTTGYIDPLPNDDTLPFYWTKPEDTNPTRGNKTATTYHFFDNSQRTPDSNATPINWSGELLLASWTDPDPGPGGNDWINASPLVADQNVTVYDGIRWGWTLVDVPEPDSLALLLAGLFGLGIWRVLARRSPATGLS